MATAKLPAHLAASARATATSTLDRFPPLIIYRSLGSEPAIQALAEAATARLKAKSPATSEVLAIPRRGFGARPVEILSPVSRTALSALVRVLESSLVEPSRADGAWKAHRDFGREGPHTHVVELDYASCYEMIDHTDLRHELLLRSFDIDTIDALMALLAGVGHHGRGLPQMLDASDRLADTYLSVLDRNLARSCHIAHRFADDFRILANNWEESMSIIDLAADIGRSIGLVLSSSKTAVRLKETLDSQEQERRATLLAFVTQAGEDLAWWLENDPYASGDSVPPDHMDVLRGALWALLENWHEQFASHRGAAGSQYSSDLASFTSLALSVLGDHAENLRVELLRDLIFDDPTRFGTVSRYLEARLQVDGAEYVTKVVTDLSSAGRQGSWAKLWILHLVEQLGSTVDLNSALQDWVRAQLNDGHEVVRAQATWTLATQGALIDRHLQHAYPGATDVSVHALAAACARQERDAGAPKLNRSLTQAIRNDGRLNQEAYAWGV